MAEKIFAEAINEAIAEEMRRDSNVFIMGGVSKTLSSPNSLYKFAVAP